MNWDFAFLGLVIVSFLTAFYFLNWGRARNSHLDEKDSWKFNNPGRGGV